MMDLDFQGDEESQCVLCVLRRQTITRSEAKGTRRDVCETTSNSQGTQSEARLGREEKL